MPNPIMQVHPSNANGNLSNMLSVWLYDYKHRLPTFTLPSNTPRPVAALAMHLCSWFAWPLGWFSTSLLCRSCSCPAPASKKCFIDVVVSGPSWCMPRSCRVRLPPTRASVSW
eukprot:GHRR01037699.1.p2 GENE.GHRR01037699.1~~GHRR01037699.1.p2  ORF type:complete len:113 (+),score=20.83 GHRR01037699.1:52-390(+)